MAYASFTSRTWAFAFLAVSTGVSALQKKCPVYTNCAVPWNIESNDKIKCCLGTATVHGCRSSGTTKNCWCDSYVQDTCSAHRKHKCPTIGKVKQQRKLNVKMGNTVVSQMQNQVDAGGMNMNTFFNQFFMQVYKQAYEQDALNLVAFNALMSEKNPPTPRAPVADFVFSIFKSLISLLPETGNIIKLTLEVTGSSIAVATNDNGQNYKQEIAWKQFLQTQALKYTQSEQTLKIGLWSWTQKWWKKNNFPAILKKSSSQSFKTMAKLINHLWSNVKTQQEAYLSFIASYFNSVGAGLQVKCTAGSKQALEWSITQVPNSVPLMKNLMKLTDNCLDPKTNFKDAKGKPVAMAVVGESCEKNGGIRQKCSTGVIASTASLAITGAFKQAKDPTSLNPNLCYHKTSKKFSITFSGSTHSSKHHNAAIVNGNGASDDNKSYIIPVTVSGVVVVVVVVMVVVAVVIARKVMKGPSATVDEEAKVSEQSENTHGSMADTPGV